MRKIAVCGWRGRLVIDAYLRLPDGMGFHKTVTDSYIDLAEIRGHSLPHDYGATKQGIKNQVQRLSSDARQYRESGWGRRYPDLFRKIEDSRWGLREEIFTQIKMLNLDDRSLLAGIPPIQDPPAIQSLFLSNDPDEFDPEQVYVDECMDSFLPPGLKLIKIGMSVDTKQRRNGLQTGSAWPIKRRFAINGHYSPELENKIKTALKSNQTGGGKEWFLVTENEYGKIGTIIVKHNLDYIW